MPKPITYEDEFMTPARVAEQSGRTNQTAAYNFGANLRRVEEKLDNNKRLIRRSEDKVAHLIGLVVKLTDLVEQQFELLEQQAKEKAKERITGEYPAVKLFANMMDGNVYWSVKGGPYMKHGASIWPEVLEPAGFGNLQPTDTVDLTGWTAVYTASADGKNPKVTQLIPPTTASTKSRKPTQQPNPNLKAADLWRQEAISCTDEFMFDTAVAKAIPYYTDADQVAAARAAICGPWVANQAEATLRALETYAEKVQVPSNRPITETKKAALTAARQTYNKGVG